MSKIIQWAAVVWLTLAMPAGANAGEVDRLLDLLVKKGTITADEAAEFRSDLAIEKQQDLDKQVEKEKKKGKDYPVTAKRPVKIGGYAQIRGTQTTNDPANKVDNTNDTFLIRRARLSLAGNISDAADYKLQIDVGNEGRKVVKSVDFTKKTTETDSVQRLVLLDAQVNYALDPLSRLSVGQFKIPFSQENLISSTELDTINRSQVTEKLVPGRDIGSQGRDIGFTYNRSLTRKSGEKSVDYSLGLFNGAGINAAEDNDRKDVSARVVAYPTKCLQLAASYYDGARKASRDIHDRTGFDLAYFWPNSKTFLKSEYVVGNDAGIRKDGWYALLAHNFSPQWQGVLKFDTFDPNTDKANNASDVLTIGFNRFISPNLKWQVNYEMKDEEGAEIDNDALLAQFQVKF